MSGLRAEVAALQSQVAELQAKVGAMVAEAEADRAAASDAIVEAQQVRRRSLLQNDSWRVERWWRVSSHATLMEPVVSCHSSATEAFRHGHGSFHHAPRLTQCPPHRHKHTQLWLVSVC